MVLSSGMIRTYGIYSLLVSNSIIIVLEFILRSLIKVEWFLISNKVPAVSTAERSIISFYLLEFIKRKLLYFSP